MLCVVVVTVAVASNVLDPATWYGVQVVVCICERVSCVVCVTCATFV